MIIILNAILKGQEFLIFYDSSFIERFLVFGVYARLVNRISCQIVDWLREFSHMHTVLAFVFFVVLIDHLVKFSFFLEVVLHWLVHVKLFDCVLGQAVLLDELEGAGSQVGVEHVFVSCPLSRSQFNVLGSSTDPSGPNLDQFLRLPSRIHFGFMSSHRDVGCVIMLGCSMAFTHYIVTPVSRRRKRIVFWNILDTVAVWECAHTITNMSFLHLKLWFLLRLGLDKHARMIITDF